MRITPNPAVNRTSPGERGHAGYRYVGAHNHCAMADPISVTRSDIGEHLEVLRTSAEQTQIRLAELAGTEGPLEFLYQLKFNAIGCDPLSRSRELNVIEQVNQTFTYLASFNGAEFLFSRHPKVQRLTLNLGTAAGSDIETPQRGGIAAEVFAAVTPRNNGKLTKDIKKVSGAKAKHRYVLFMSPECQAGPYPVTSNPSGVIVWSLGCAL